MRKFMLYVLDRMAEASTWRGLTLLSTALGIVISPEVADGVIASGMAVSGLIGALSRG